MKLSVMSASKDILMVLDLKKTSLAVSLGVELSYKLKGTLFVELYKPSLKSIMSLGVIPLIPLNVDCCCFCLLNW